MSINWKMPEWTTDDFIKFCDTLDRETAFFLKEFVSKKIRTAEARAERAEQEVSDQRWVRDQQLGYVQGSN
jgi:hypothetical protein